MADGPRGLHDRLNRISHWDVNVSDLQRSLAWYEATTALRPVARTRADQAFPSLGIEHGRFEGVMLRDATKPAGWPMLHLVEWRQPRPVGTPYLSHANVGWFRIAVSVSDIAEARAVVEAQGSAPFTPTTDAMVRFHPDMPLGSYRVFSVHDPDGITLEFVNTFGSAPPQVPAVVAHNTSDVDRYISFYLETLGLDFVQGVQTEGPVPNVYSPLGGDTQIDGAFFGVRGNASVVFDWLEWTQSRGLPTPYEAPNHLGIMRCALEVDDLDAAYEQLVASPWAQRTRLVLGPPEEWDLGPRLGTRRVVNFTDPEGVAFQLVGQRTSRKATLHPFGFDAFPSAE